MNKQNPHTESLKGKIDWSTAVIPFVLIAFLCISFMAAPDGSRQILDKIRVLLGDTFGLYYLVIGLGVFLLSIYLAFSRYGSIRLGGPNEKPKYSDFAWSSMMFTAGLAADILFYSCCEWILYASDPHTAEMGTVHEWAATYPLFHWGPIPWGFYLVLSAAFGFMLHVRKRSRQKYSEACRPVLGNRVDGWAGKLIDLIAVFALLAGTATTFSLATPLLAGAISNVTGIPQSTGLTLVILVVVCAIYTFSVYFGMKGVQLSAATCTWLFFGLLAYVFFFGGQTRFIIEEGITALGNMETAFLAFSVSPSSNALYTFILSVLRLFAAIICQKNILSNAKPSQKFTLYKHLSNAKGIKNDTAATQIHKITPPISSLFSFLGNTFLIAFSLFSIKIPISLMG